jgi:hypothetical protein
MGNRAHGATCKACGARFGRQSWLSLAFVERIEPEEVTRLLRDWPPQFCIEVRRCRSCDREIAAKREMNDVTVVEREVGR